MREEEMNCKEICELLIAYLDGEVTPEEKADIEAHLPSCPQCRAELEALSATQVSLRGVLKSMAEEISPSPQAWEKVRARLNTKGSWIEGLRKLLTSKTWQVATVTAAIIVIAVVAVVWQFGGVGQAPLIPAPAPTIPAPPRETPGPAPAPAPGPSPTVRFDRVPDVVSPYGETAEINLSFTNEASETRTISPFPPEIRIIELPNLRPPDRVVRAFPVGNNELKLQPGESASHSVNWDQRNDSGKQVPPGWYSVEVTLATSRGSATRVLVLPPEGVMEKTIEVNQSQTVNGITITLERVELTATGMKVYAFNTPPDYNLPQGPMLAPPQFMILHASAEYGVNGGVVKQTFPSGIRFLENGMLHTWDEYLDPIPKNAKELTFRITKLGDWEGPWEFKVLLE